MEIFEIAVEYEGEQGLFARKLNFIQGTPKTLKFEVAARNEDHGIAKIKRWLLDNPPSFDPSTVQQPVIVIH